MRVWYRKSKKNTNKQNGARPTRNGMRRRVASEETERALPGFAKPTRTQTTRATRATNYEGSVSVFRFQGGGGGPSDADTEEEEEEEEEVEEEEEEVEEASQHRCRLKRSRSLA